MNALLPSLCMLELHIETLLSPLASLQIRKQQFEPVAQRLHIRVLILLQLKSLRYDLDGPALQLSVETSFEAEVEVAWILWVNAECVVTSFGVGLRICGQPLLCRKSSVVYQHRREVEGTYRTRFCYRFDTCRAASFPPPSSPLP